MTWFYTIKYGVSNRRRTLHILSVKRVWCLSLFEYEDWDFGWDSTQAYIGNPDWHLMNARERKPAGLEIEAAWVEQEFFDSDSDDAFFVAGQAGVAAHHDDFFEGIIGVHEGAFFLFAFCCIWQGESRLQIVSFTSLIGDEVDFYLFTCPLFALFHNPYVHGKSPGNQLVIDGIFHQVRRFLLAEVQPGVTQSHILEIILQGAADVLASFHVIAFCVVDNESIF